MLTAGRCVTHRPHRASPPPPPLQSATKEQGFQIVKQFFPTGASGPLARRCAAQELCPGLPHGWACDGQAKLPRLPSPFHSLSSARISLRRAPPQHHASPLCREGCGGEKANGCLLSSIPNLFCIHLHAGHRAIHTTGPICELQIICQSSWRVCVCVCVWRELQDSGLCNINYT